MAQQNKARRSYLAFAVLFLLLSIGAFTRAWIAAHDRALVFLPDKLGGVGDTWMWPGQAYFLSAFCAVVAVWLLVRFVRSRSR
jgi:hypothetical protein